MQARAAAAAEREVAQELGASCCAREEPCKKGVAQEIVCRSPVGLVYAARSILIGQRTVLTLRGLEGGWLERADREGERLVPVQAAMMEEIGDETENDWPLLILAVTDDPSSPGSPPFLTPEL